MYNNPSQYFNGTAPANVTTSCQIFPIINEPPVRCTSPDSYIWYDELHPSEQSSRIVAREFLNLISGKSKYASYWP
jgi:phospholipase/lecithinase/hemolysin